MTFASLQKFRGGSSLRLSSVPCRDPVAAAIPRWPKLHVENPVVCVHVWRRLTQELALTDSVADLFRLLTFFMATP